MIRTIYIATAALTLTLAGCQARPGSIVWERTTTRVMPAPASVPVVDHAPTPPDAPVVPAAPAGPVPVVLTGRPASVRLLQPATPSTTITTERLTIRQPADPAGTARLVLDASGSARVEVPAAHRPAGPASPVARAMGWLLWACGACGVLGIVLVVGRFAGLGWLSAAVPVGLGWGLLTGGWLGVAALVALDAIPWAIWVALIIGLGVALAVGMRDNLAAWFGRGGVA